MCDYAAFCALLRKMHKGKATSLDRVSKEMLELLPDELRRPFFEAAMGVATPDEHGVRTKPEYWTRVPVKLLNKKVPSPVVEKKRDIGLPSQLLKLQAGQRLSKNGANGDLGKASVVAGEEARRVGRVHGLLGSLGARQDALGAKAEMGQGIGAQSRDK